MKHVTVGFAAMIVCCLGWCIWLSGTALAAAKTSSPGISASPSLQFVDILSDQPTKRLSVDVTNNTNFKTHLDLTVLDFGSLNETGGLAFQGATGNDLIKKYGLSGWMTLAKPVLELDPHSSVKVEATIDNQSTMQPGGHYAAILISAKTIGSTPKNTIGVNQSLSSLVFARKLGGERYDLRLLGISHNGTRLKLPSKVTLRFSNPGNVHVIPRGIIKLLDGQRVVSQGVINEESGLVMPELTRRFAVPLSLSSKTSLWPYKTYELRVDYRYDSISRFASKRVFIKVINWLWFAGLLVVVALLAGLWWLWRRNRSKFHKEVPKIGEPLPRPAHRRKIPIKSEDE